MNERKRETGRTAKKNSEVVVRAGFSDSSSCLSIISGPPSALLGP